MIRIGSTEVDVVQGDISQEDADGIVCPANNYLWMGSGVAGRIKKKGGGEIETRAVAQGPVEVGTAVVTSGGRLKARHVIHAVAAGQDLKADADAVASATAAGLKTAEAAGCRTLAVADIGTESGGLEVHLCAKAMLDAAIDHLLAASELDRLRFVLETDTAYQAFHDHLLGRFSARR